MPTIPENMLSNLFENTVTTFVKENLEEELSGEYNRHNGYYKRSLHTGYGHIEDIQVPRVRNGQFQTQVFEPYQRRDRWLEETVIQMCKSGMGTCDVAPKKEKEQK